MSRRRSFTSRRQKIVAGSVVVVALGLLTFKGLTDALDYYIPANQAVAQRAQLGTKDFRIQGDVMDDVRTVAGGLLRFDITSHGAVVDVVSTGSPSSLFKPGMPVVLAGHWQGDVFSSYQIMVQHGSSYVEKPGRSSGSSA
ncbi:MAG TPA: cytochrome c maturation protein CcmE [Acidimicrobiales bacterium]|nr:cytochrome c maturation protein CcmE [Acidimicrobiales bacterium]